MTRESLTTIAEQSGFRNTGRTDEVERLCQAFANTWPDAVRIIEFGRSAEGRTMLALAVSRADPKKVPVLMLQAGIHPGESDGKDAGFIALRELLGEPANAPVLERIRILFVPAFNVDGHERFGRWNRPNQRGPEETGWRTTAQNLNLNRDYTKADAPEMQAMLRLVNDWDPLVCADLHVTDGADFEPDVSIQVEPINQGDPRLFASGVQLRDELIAILNAQGSIALPFYPDLAEADNPASGFQLTVYSPRFSTGYFPARNRFTVLVETHSWKDYAMRVRVTRNSIRGLVDLVVVHGEKWLAEVRDSDAKSGQLPGTNAALEYASAWREPSTPGVRVREIEADEAITIDFRGYAYTRLPSPISGNLVTAYDPGTRQIWRVPFRNKVRVSRTVRAPREYIVPPALAQEIGAKLALHGIHFENISNTIAAESVEVFRATQVSFAGEPMEGRFRTMLAGDWNAESRDIKAGSLVVPVGQPLARLVLALLEPQAPDSFAAWGFFNAHFEQKEYMEAYVAEQIAKDMLARDAALATQFKRRLAEDSAFAADPRTRLEFFLCRHESRDECLNLYPIFRAPCL
jgi:hypothetical protein